MKNAFKKLAVALILACTVAFSATLSACEMKTDHPQAKITIEFDGTDYEINYKMFRNMYPQTVQHFIELADKEFYDGMIVHDYQSSDMITGGYNYNSEQYVAAKTAQVFASYLADDNICKEQQYYNLFAEGALTPSVYKKVDYDANGKAYVKRENALPTLIGEFGETHPIKKGALSADYGCLKTYYYEKSGTEKIAVVKDGNSEPFTGWDYKYNCATSLFEIQHTNSSPNTTTKYCVFATLLDDNAKKSFDNLIDAIEAKIATYSKSDDFTQKASVAVDKLDKFAPQDNMVEFKLPIIPIVIKTVKITKR